MVRRPDAATKWISFIFTRIHFGQSILDTIRCFSHDFYTARCSDNNITNGNAVTAGVL